MKNILLAATLSGMLAVPLVAVAAVDRFAPADKTDQSASQEIGSRKPMKPDEPMPTEMAKPGMKKGDVKTGAERKQFKLEEMMREEMK